MTKTNDIFNISAKRIGTQEASLSKRNIRDKREITLSIPRYLVTLPSQSLSEVPLFETYTCVTKHSASLTHSATHGIKIHIASVKYPQASQIHPLSIIFLATRYPYIAEHGSSPPSAITRISPLPISIEIAVKRHICYCLISTVEDEAFLSTHISTLLLSSLSTFYFSRYDIRAYLATFHVPQFRKIFPQESLFPLFGLVFVILKDEG